MGVDINTREVEALARNLAAAPDRCFAEAKRVISKGALNVKQGAQQKVRDSIGPVGRTHLPHYPKAISYDTKSGKDWVHADIGPETSRLQGGMGRGVELGSARTPPIPHLFPALDDEEPNTVRFLLDAAEGALR